GGDRRPAPRVATEVIPGAARASASAPRRQDPDGLERPDDRRVCTDGARHRLGRVPRIRSARGGVRPRAPLARRRTHAAAALPGRSRDIDAYAEDYAGLIFGLLEL